jgi:hypothetical protein
LDSQGGTIGASAGIAAGGTVGSCGLCAFGLLFYRRKKKNDLQFQNEEGKIQTSDAFQGVSKDGKSQYNINPIFSDT